MCGFIGVVKSGRKDEERLRDAINTMSHRGPDAEGSWTDDDIALRHKRLSIIDLSETGNQPIIYKQFVIVHNGEVYNYLELRDQLKGLGYSFEGESDTEVIIKAYAEWGKDCVNKFNGMWAFAIWDSKLRKLFCSRDRIGIKPFYYYCNNDTFIFASEIKAILEYVNHAFSICWPSVIDFIHNGYSRSLETWFKDVFKLPPAHNMNISLSKDNELKSTKYRYWSIPDNNNSFQVFDRHKAEHLIRDSISLRLRSDVPIGFHLSGGLDSSTIVSIASKMNDETRTFTGYFEEHKRFDERKYIGILERQSNLDNTEVCVTGDGFRDNIYELVRVLDHPEAGPSSYAQFCVNQKMKESGIKVSLGGQGGDEIFAGYNHHLIAFMRSLIEQHKPIRMLTESLFFMANPSFLKESFQYLKRMRRKIDSAMILNPDIANTSNNEIYGSIQKGVNLDNRLKWDIENYLQSLLHIEDRTSMAVSIESRLPFLDYRLIEYMFTISPADKIRFGYLKYLLRQTTKNILPREIVYRKDKMGFPSPIGIWFSNNLKKWMYTILFEDNSNTSMSIFNQKYLKAIFDSHHWPEKDFSDLLWKALVVKIWLDVYKDKLLIK